MPDLRDVSQQINTQYKMLISEYDAEIKQVEKKAKRAMRFVLFMKIMLSIATVAAVGAWLRNHGAKEVWAFIIVLAELADAMMDTLPYAEQRVKLPQMKIKLVDILLEVQRDLIRFERGELDDAEAIDRYYNHRNAWVKSLS